MLSEITIKKLEGKGFSRWQKGNLDRLYINASQLGLVCWYYKTGNISSAEFNGERISNCQARRYKAAKTFIDAGTGKVHGDIPELVEAATAMLEDAEKAG